MIIRAPQNVVPSYDYFLTYLIVAESSPLSLSRPTKIGPTI